MRKINLQLFADNEEDGVETAIDTKIVDEFELEDEEEAEEIPEEPEITEEESEEQPPIKKGQDKVTKALVNTKRASKEKDKLIAELKSELDNIKKHNQQKQFEEKKQQITNRYIEDGYEEKEAHKRADSDIRLEHLEQLVKRNTYERQAERIAERFPDIWDNFDRLVDVAEKTGWSLDKVARAELEEASNYDIKTKVEQEAVIRRQKAVQKQPVTGEQPAKKEPIKLSPQDERVFQMMIKAGKTITREEFIALVD